MKGIVTYYSGAGSTKKIANAIYRGMKQVIEADVASVKEVDPKDMGKYDLIGVGSPDWFFREVANVRGFIYNMPDMTGKLGFPFFTHGGSPHGFFHSMVPPMQRKGLTIIGWNDWFGSGGHCLHGTSPSACAGHPDAIDKKEAEDWGREIAERAQRIYAGEKDLIPEIPHGPQADPMWRPHGVMEFFPGAPQPHRNINMEKCIYPECTLCVDNCEAHAIDFSVTPPVFKYPCLNCCLCDRLCPQGAIEISDEELRRIRPMYTINMEKCKYPECTLCVDYCPMDAIDFSVKPPAIKYSCEAGDLCFAICPHDAIEIPNLDITHAAMWNRGGSGRRGREDHPFARWLNEQEAIGRFRRLLPKDKIGDVPIYEMKAPRFDIIKAMSDDD